MWILNLFIFSLIWLSIPKSILSKEGFPLHRNRPNLISKWNLTFKGNLSNNYHNLNKICRIRIEHCDNILDHWRSKGVYDHNSTYCTNILNSHRNLPHPLRIFQLVFHDLTEWQQINRHHSLLKTLPWPSYYNWQHNVTGSSHQNPGHSHRNQIQPGICK